MKKITYILTIMLLLAIISCASGPEVLFDANGGAGELEPIKVAKDGTVTLPKNTYTRDGYDFLGWDVNDDEVFDFADGEVFTTAAIIEEASQGTENKDVKDIVIPTLKAVWALEK